VSDGVRADHADIGANWRCEYVLTAASHFGHRESGGIVVDLFWNRGNLEDEFRVEVEDRREGVRFVLHPTTGRAALQAFYHPFSAGKPRPRERQAGRPGL
jgi:hypothetical protein